MLHNPKTIRGIEVWSRRLAWVNLAYGLIGLVVLFILQQRQPVDQNHLFHVNPVWVVQANVVMNFLRPIVGILALFLLLMGVSLVTRLLRIFYEAISRD